MPKKNIKKKCQMKHLKSRWQERLGTEMSYNTYNELLYMIKNNKSVSVKKQTHRIRIHELVYNDKLLKIIYDKQRTQIVTVIPLGEAPKVNSVKVISKKDNVEKPKLRYIECPKEDLPKDVQEDIVLLIRANKIRSANMLNEDIVEYSMFYEDEILKVLYDIKSWEVVLVTSKRRTKQHDRD